MADDLFAETEAAKATADFLRWKNEGEGLSVSQMAEMAGVTEVVIEWWLAVARLPWLTCMRVPQDETAAGGD